MLPSVSPPDSETRRWYEEKVREFGYDHRGLGFRTRGSQERRFHALAALGDFNGRRLLDVGCGFGDFLAYLLERGIRTIYTGLDICAPMITRCHDRFPVSSGIFAVADVLDYQPQAPYDYIVASGIFGLEAEDTHPRVRPTLERLFSWCRTGFAVNFLSALAPEKAPKRLYFHPREVLDWMAPLTPALRLDHGYLPNDFTVHVYKTPPWTQAASGGSR